MKGRGPGLKVRLIKPNGEVVLTEAFPTERRAEMRFERLVEACIKDGWFGSRIQCLSDTGGIVREVVVPYR